MTQLWLWSASDATWTAIAGVNVLNPGQLFISAIYKRTYVFPNLVDLGFDHLNIMLSTANNKVQNNVTLSVIRLEV